MADNDDLLLWAKTYHVESLLPKLKSNGFDTLWIIKSMDQNDVKLLGIEQKGDIKKLDVAIKNLSTVQVPVISSTIQAPIISTSTQQTNENTEEEVDLTGDSPKYVRHCGNCHIIKKRGHKCGGLCTNFDLCHYERGHPEISSAKKKRKLDEILEKKKIQEEVKKQKHDDKELKKKLLHVTPLPTDMDKWFDDEVEKLVTEDPVQFSSKNGTKGHVNAVTSVAKKYKGMLDKRDGEKKHAKEVKQIIKSNPGKKCVDLVSDKQIIVVEDTNEFDSGSDSLDLILKKRNSC